MSDQASLIDRILTLPQYLIPHHGLSRVMYKLTRCDKRWWKNLFVTRFVDMYQVDMTQAVEEDPRAYKTFNEFFTRPLKSSARPITSTRDALACPVDGAVSQAGKITDGKIFQAKGCAFTVSELLGAEDDVCRRFANGSYATLYLSPRDYHRIHSPLDATLTQMIHVPGRLFSVNPRTTRSVNGLFARNERVVTIFDTPHGCMALVLVGAIFVSSMETVWAGEITPPPGSKIRHWSYGGEGQASVKLAKGEELGRFNMGSTVVLLFEPGRAQWGEQIQPGRPVRMGEEIAKLG